MCRKIFNSMAKQIEQRDSTIADLARAAAAYKKRLDRLTPPPEVRAAMSVRSSSMRPILATVNGRRMVIVAPPEGFEDPDHTYGRIAMHYGGKASGEATP